MISKRNFRDRFTSSELLKNTADAQSASQTRAVKLLRFCVALWGGGTGGANRDRTDDLLLAKQALSQLSYGPVGLPWELIGGSGWVRTIDPRLIKTVL